MTFFFLFPRSDFGRLNLGRYDRRTSIGPRKLHRVESVTFFFLFPRSDFGGLNLGRYGRRTSIGPRKLHRLDLMSYLYKYTALSSVMFIFIPLHSLLFPLPTLFRPCTRTLSDEDTYLQPCCSSSFQLAACLRLRNILTSHVRLNRFWTPKIRSAILPQTR
jgi:hypothetical protein